MYVCHHHEVQYRSKNELSGSGGVCGSIWCFGIPFVAWFVFARFCMFTSLISLIRWSLSSLCSVINRGGHEAIYQALLVAGGCKCSHTGYDGRATPRTFVCLNCSVFLWSSIIIVKKIKISKRSVSWSCIGIILLSSSSTTKYYY